MLIAKTLVTRSGWRFNAILRLTFTTGTLHAAHDITTRVGYRLFFRARGHGNDRRAASTAESPSMAADAKAVKAHHRRFISSPYIPPNRLVGGGIAMITSPRRGHYAGTSHDSADLLYRAYRPIPPVSSMPTRIPSFFANAHAASSVPPIFSRRQISSIRCFAEGRPKFHT